MFYPSTLLILLFLIILLIFLVLLVSGLLSLLILRVNKLRSDPTLSIQLSLSIQSLLDLLPTSQITLLLNLNCISLFHIQVIA
jgi:hypothetical protein